jgi:hypothetical protein
MNINFQFFNQRMKINVKMRSEHNVTFKNEQFTTCVVLDYQHWDLSTNTTGDSDMGSPRSRWKYAFSGF